MKNKLHTLLRIKKNMQIISLYAILSSFVLFISCDDEESEQEQEVVFENIDKLSEDPMFLEYLQLESEGTKRIVDLRVAYNLREKLNNLNDSEKIELAESFGYTDINAMNSYFIEKYNTIIKLNEKYKFNQQEESKLNEIINVVIKEHMLIFQYGNNTNKRSSIKYIDECMQSGLRQALDGDLACDLDTGGSYVLSNSEFLQSQLIGEPCDALNPDQTHFFPCAVQKDLDYYIISYNSWASLACCISQVMNSRDCPTDTNWCSNYLCC
jgi:hypothetical protein